MDRSDKRPAGRRDFLKKAAYTAPAILSLQAVSAVAKAGSEKPGNEPTQAEKIKKEKKAKKQKKKS